MVHTEAVSLPGDKQRHTHIKRQQQQQQKRPNQECQTAQYRCQPQPPQFEQKWYRKREKKVTSTERRSNSHQQTQGIKKTTKQHTPFWFGERAWKKWHEFMYLGPRRQQVKTLESGLFCASDSFDHLSWNSLWKFDMKSTEHFDFDLLYLLHETNILRRWVPSNIISLWYLENDDTTTPAIRISLNSVYECSFLMLKTRDFWLCWSVEV